MPVDLEALRTFVKVADLGSFTRAGDHLGVSKSRVSLRIQGLETEVGSRLLQRSTRAVRLTADGEQLLLRARRLVDEADDLATLFAAPSSLRGTVRVDLTVSLARHVVIPRLPEFFSAHPQLEVQLSATDRRVDLVREGFDCVVRVGALPDSGMVGRRLGILSMMNCASPAYLLKHGTPRSIDDLDDHVIIHYSQRFGSDVPAFEYPEGSGYREKTMRSLITVNGADAYHAACLAGFGIIQAPRYGMREAIAAGALVEVLPGACCKPMDVWLIHGHGRNVPKRVRAFLGWLPQVLAPHLG